MRNYFKLVNKSLILILYLTIWGSSVFSQNGKFYLSQFDPESNDIDNQNFDIVQDRFGVIYIANRSGIVTFDGHRWELVKTPYSIFSLAMDTAHNVLYAAGKDGVGKLDLNRQNDLKYRPLLDNTTEKVTDIFALIFHHEELYFINQKHAFIYNLTSKNLKKIASDYTGDFLQVFKFEDQIHVNTSISGLKLLGDNKLENTPVVTLQDKDVSLLIENKPSDSYLISFADNSLSLYTNGQFKDLNLKEDQAYLDEAGVMEGLWVNDSLVVLSTLKAGVVFINILKGKIEEIVNYQSGLPDNEVYALSMDSNDGVWIAHSEGFTRISPTFPFKSFNRYPGLEGKTLSVNSHKGKLFVGTTLGLFCLEEIKQYSQKISYSKRNIRVEVKEEKREPEQKSKKGIFNFLKRNSNLKDKKEVGNSTKFRQKVVYESTVEKSLEGVRYEYKKIPGIGSKVFQLESHGEQLFSGGLDGLYVVKDSVPRLITNDPVRYYFISDRQQKLIVNTYADQLKVYDISSAIPSEIYAFGEYRDYVQYVFEDYKGRLWFCSPDEIYWVKFERNELSDTERYPIDNPHYFITYGTVAKDSIFFINEQGTSFFNERENKLQRLNTEKNPAERYLTGPNGTVYTHSGDRWRQIGSTQGDEKLNLISLFKNVSFISNDQKGNYWIITSENELYGLSSHHENSEITPYSLYLKKAQNNSKSFTLAPNLKFDQDQSSLYFEVAQPEYSGILEIEYQYKLKGLPSKWSDWSNKHNVISFPYLPDGKYELLVRSKTALGTVTDMAPIAFKVVPPYWKRPWFYFLEFTIIALILYGSIRVKRLGYKYRFMSRLLALLVLIIVVEFIQTVAENRFGTQSSPVLDFVIQVTMAIIILPVESVLRKYIFKDKEVKVMDFITLKDKKK